MINAPGVLGALFGVARSTVYRALQRDKSRQLTISPNYSATPSRLL